MSRSPFADFCSLSFVASVLVGICATIVLAHALLHTLPPLEDGTGDEMSEFIGSDERSFEAGGTQV